MDNGILGSANEFDLDIRLTSSSGDPRLQDGADCTCTCAPTYCDMRCYTDYGTCATQCGTCPETCFYTCELEFCGPGGP